MPDGPDVASNNADVEIMERSRDESVLNSRMLSVFEGRPQGIALLRYYGELWLAALPGRLRLS